MEETQAMTFAKGGGIGDFFGAFGPTYIINWADSEALRTITDEPEEMTEEEFEKTFEEENEKGAKEEIEYTAEQEAAFMAFLENRISMIVGAPGVGKSTCIKRIVDFCKQNNISMTLCAPSGKAAKRLSEVVDAPAYTIHKTLGAVPGLFGGFQFNYNSEQRLPHMVVIVDEASMVDVELMQCLMQAINDRAKFVIVGDDNQLPSVGAGAVLRDLIQSGIVTTTVLSKIHRNSGDIVNACHEMKHGRMFPLRNEINLEKGHNLRHVEMQKPQDIVDAIVKITTSNLPKNRGFDPIWDIQVLSPVNKRTLMSCDNINIRLQAALNPDGLAIAGTMFRVGDKVINIKNETLDGELIVNGDIGKIIGQEGDAMQVEFQFPTRTVNIDKIKNNLLMAYCCTTHRYQGSEVPVVLIPFHPSLGIFVNRAWIYTAISRAKQLCITVGMQSEIKSVIKRVNSKNRQTRLSTILRQKYREAVREL